MRVIDSGMPEESYWNSLFDIPRILDWLGLERITGPIVEIGCGYGTFTVPVARKTRDIVYAIDIDPQMLLRTQENCSSANVSNVHFHLCDVLEDGTGLESSSSGMVLLFNILHFQERNIMLREACRILKPAGVVAIIHWRKDIKTPRGPSIETRPDQKTLLDSIRGLDLHLHRESQILEPYHWGIQFVK